MGEQAPRELARGQAPTARQWWPEFAAVMVGSAALIGAGFVVLFAFQRVELEVGLALTLVGVIALAVAGAAGWSGPRTRIGVSVFGVGWLMWSVLSGSVLAMFVSDTMPPGVLKLLTVGSLLFGPPVASMLACIVADRFRRHAVSRHSLPTTS